MSLALDAALNRLVLEQGYGPGHGRSLREWAMSQLRMDSELNNFVDQYVRLRVALSLCPATALTHSRVERVSRVEKIEQYLLEEHLVTEEDSRHLAAIVDQVISNWLTPRVNVAGFKEALIRRDGSQCKSCHVDMGEPATEAPSVVHVDPYKLTWVNPERSLAFTVDHRDPVSKFGTNELANLELLCRYCNEGKEDGAPLMLKHEVELATALPVLDVAVAGGLVGKSARLVYRVLRRDNFVCCVCGSSANELTVRKIAQSGLAILSNLRSVCFACALNV